ncbi:hypothetical protein ACRALDRAFT_1062476 [Sodiomyces alcalophilus JCM 7366]|uniref:uncharacterized protein n=1 Tax=Sodiomyces alcalophilus JCM 7366 TaxID=591952 RepID=UPI0039B6DE11
MGGSDAATPVFGDVTKVETVPSGPAKINGRSNNELSPSDQDEMQISPSQAHDRRRSSVELNGIKTEHDPRDGNGHSHTQGATMGGRTDGANGTKRPTPGMADDSGGVASQTTAGADDNAGVDDTRYPPLLPAAPSRAGHERHVWRAGGVRFAPLRIPFERRAQTTAVLMHSLSIALFVSVFFFMAAIPLNWPLLVPYLIHLSLSTAASDGRLRFRSEFIRSLPIWTLFARYYPAKLHKTYDLPPSRKYIFGYHPHGIISHGAWAAFATNALGFSEKFPGITNTLLTLDSNFRIPFYRDWILAMGIRSVSKESIWNTLTRGGHDRHGMGRAVTIVVGGARESLEAGPGTLRLILKGRKGFIKMALRTGSDLVPVLGFGENDLYDQLSPRSHPNVRRIQLFFLNVFKFTLPALHGRGILNYDVGLMPYRRPLNIVVGKPIRVTTTATSQPDQAEIDRLHALYVEEVQKLWDAYKDQFAKDRRAELQFIA